MADALKHVEEVKADRIYFRGSCPFLSCGETKEHSHPICQACGAVWFGNIFACQNCLENKRRAGQ